jgi:hypothetical protein
MKSLFATQYEQHTIISLSLRDARSNAMGELRCKWSSMSVLQRKRNKDGLWDYAAGYAFTWAVPKCRQGADFSSNASPSMLR